VVTAVLDARSARAVAEDVRDPELPVLTLGDLGIVRDVRVDGGRVTVALTPTYSGCPAITAMRADVARALREAGADDVEVHAALEPAWSSDWITAAGRAKLAAAGIAPPLAAPARTSGPVPLTLARPLAVTCPRCGSADTEQTAAFGPTACTALLRCRDCGEPFEHVKAV